MASPIIYIFSTGTEILQGYSTDRNSPWISMQLQALGLPTARHIALPDSPEELEAGLTEAAQRADLVITTGGLGPTGDDRNRQAFCGAWGCGLVEDAEAVRLMHERFARRGRAISANNLVQAQVPAGSIVLQNHNGTAPGFYLRAAAAGRPVRAALLALPGPPREMQPMFAQQAAALIGADFAGGSARLRTLTLHTANLPESHVDAALKDLYDADPKVDLAMLASLGHVQVRLNLAGADDAENDALAEAWRAKVIERLGPAAVYGENNDTLASVVGALLKQRGQTLATAESCTAGLLASRLTEVPGSSAWFHEGFVTYANAAKTLRLGVPRELLDAHGAVSGEVACAMALGARRAANADWALAITGIAGPDGGSEEKPVGLVWIGISGPDGEAAHRFVLMGDRGGVRHQAAQLALELLRRTLLGLTLSFALPFQLQHQQAGGR